MEKKQLLELFDREMRIEITIPGVKKEMLPGLVRMRREPPGMYYVLFSRLAKKRIDDVIDEQIAYFRIMDQPFSWHVYEHDRPENLGDYLVAHGFQPDDDPEDVLLYTIGDSIESHVMPLGIEVKKLNHPQQLEDVRRVEEQVLGGDFSWLVERLIPHMKIQDYLNVFVAYEGYQPISTGWIYFHPESQFASLFGGATVESQRGRGIYRALVVKRLEAARQRQRRFVTVGTSRFSFPILSHMGFDPLTVEKDYIWQEEC